jgi:hypothetical protein
MLSRPALAGDVAPRPVRASIGAGELAAAGVAMVAMLAYRANVDRYYGSFIPQGTGMDHIISEEVAQLSLYVVFGLVAAVSLAIALYPTRAIERALALAASAGRRPGPVVAALAAFVLLASFVVGRVVLAGAVTTDDESVYRFIAQTLRTGSLVAPSPGGDLDFYREQFVVLTPTARYGKYPIGHPLLLALGDTVSAAHLVPPAAAALTLLLTYAVGRRVLAAPGALLGTVLLAASPHFLLTAATWLSQTSSTLFVMAALAALLAAEERQPRGFWLAAAGAALGYAFLVRPMPAGALAAGAAGWLLAAPRERTLPRRALDIFIFVLPLALAFGLFLLVNRVQSGAAWTTGYQAFHGTQAGAVGLWAETLGVDLTSASASVFAGLFRENVWLLGWPLSLLPCLLARRNRATALLWGVLGVAVAYRVLVPKAGVSPTGPIYLSEAVPALCLLAADGLLRVARGESAVGAVLAQWSARPRAAVAAIIVAASLTGLALFTLDRVADLGRMAAAQDAVWRLVQERGIHHALVFHRGVVPPWTRLSWAYFPRCNSPALDDDVLFARYREEEGSGDASLRFWRERHADRSAYLFQWPPGQPAALLPLEPLPAYAPGPR